jgi:hypothetical protein
MYAFFVTVRGGGIESTPKYILIYHSITTSTTSFLGKMRQNPLVQLILRNRTKTNTATPAQRRVCGISTSMKKNNMPYHKRVKGGTTTNTSTQRRKPEHHGT